MRVAREGGRIRKRGKVLTARKKNLKSRKDRTLVNTATASARRTKTLPLMGRYAQKGKKRPPHRSLYRSGNVKALEQAHSCNIESDHHLAEAAETLRTKEKRGPSSTPRNTTIAEGKSGEAASSSTGAPLRKGEKSWLEGGRVNKASRLSRQIL